MGIQERKEREKERRRQQILIAARRVMNQKGNRYTRMEDVAKEAELSTGTLYLYFNNKEELYTSISLRILRYLMIRLEQVVDAEDATSEERIEDLKLALLDTYEFDSQLLVNLLHRLSNETLHNLSSNVITEIRDLAEKILDKMAYILKISLKKEAYIKHHPITLAGILWGIFSGVVIREDSKKAVFEVEDSVRPNFDLAFEIFFRGLKSQHNLSNNR